MNPQNVNQTENELQSEVREDTLTITKNKLLSTIANSFFRSAETMGIDTKNKTVDELCPLMLVHCDKHYAGFARTDKYLVNPRGVDLIASVNGKKAEVTIIPVPLLFVASSNEVNIVLSFYDGKQLSTVEINCPKSFLPEHKEVTPVLKGVISVVLEKLAELDCIGASNWHKERVIEFLLSGLLYPAPSEPYIVDKSVDVGEQSAKLPGNELFTEFDSDSLITVTNY